MHMWAVTFVLTAVAHGVLSTGIFYMGPAQNHWHQAYDNKVDLRPYVGTTADNCNTDCNNMPSCTGVTIHTSYGGKKIVCYLHKIKKELIKEVRPSSTKYRTYYEKLYSVIVDYEYVGCYKDLASTRDLPTYKQALNSTMTQELCGELCAGYKYFGIQKGDQCYCGNSYGSMGVWNPKECNMNCTGNSAQTCGGNTKTNYYYKPEASSVFKNAPGPIKYLGCYRDLTLIRDMPRKFGGINTLTPEVCAKLCAGYKYFGLQYSKECYCGNTMGRFGEGYQCTMGCTGNKTIMCGGVSRNSMYRMKVVPTGGLGYEGMGCQSQPFDDVSKSIKTTSGNNTNDWCNKFCRGYPYFATLNDECQCSLSNSNINENLKEPTGKCSLPCPGDNVQFCGGPDKLYSLNRVLDWKQVDQMKYTLSQICGDFCDIIYTKIDECLPEVGSVDLKQVEVDIYAPNVAFDASITNLKCVDFANNLVGLFLGGPVTM